MKTISFLIKMFIQFYKVKIGETKFQILEGEKGKKLLTRAANYFYFTKYNAKQIGYTSLHHLCNVGLPLPPSPTPSRTK